MAILVGKRERHRPDFLIENSYNEPIKRKTNTAKAKARPAKAKARPAKAKARPAKAKARPAKAKKSPPIKTTKANEGKITNIKIKLTPIQYQSLLEGGKIALTIEYI